MPGFAATGWWVLMAPPGTPSAQVARLGSDLRKVLARPDVQEKFAQLGSQTRAMSPQELADFIRNERKLWGPVIRQVGLAVR